jgi:hypothetical protein
MTRKYSEEDSVSRREFMHTAGVAAVVGGALGSIPAVAADPSATPAMSAAASLANEICRMDAVTLAEKIRTK